MQIAFLFLFGLCSGYFGTILPSLLNTTAVKIKSKEGKEKANSFVYGALIITATQCFLALNLARWIEKNTFISDLINEIGMFIFLCLSIYFFTRSNKKTTIPNTKINREVPRFLYGLLMGTLNVFPFLFYAFVGVTLSNGNYININNISENITLTLGVIIGTFFAFQTYISIFSKISNPDHFLWRNINKILGYITIAVAIINGYKILK